MSLEHPDDPHALPSSHPCFYCHDRPSPTMIFWMGATGSVWFHPTCAVEFCVRLTSDYLAFAGPQHITLVGRQVIPQRPPPPPLGAS